MDRLSRGIRIGSNSPIPLHERFIEWLKRTYKYIKTSSRSLFYHFRLNEEPFLTFIGLSSILFFSLYKGGLIPIKILQKYFLFSSNSSKLAILGSSIAHLTFEDLMNTLLLLYSTKQMLKVSGSLKMNTKRQAVVYFVGNYISVAIKFRMQNMMSSYFLYGG